MPIYEYHCEQCGCDFERLILGSDAAECPSCKGSDVNRLMSACGFISKGAGGQTVSRSAADASCGGCAAASCAGCGH